MENIWPSERCRSLGMYYQGCFCFWTKRGFSVCLSEWNFALLGQLHRTIDWGLEEQQKPSSQKIQVSQETCPRPLINSWKCFLKAHYFFSRKTTQNHLKRGKAKPEQLLGKSCGWVLISHLWVWIPWSREYHKTELKGAPAAQGIN